MSREGRIAYRHKQEVERIDPRPSNRADPLLVQVVEELGAEANGDSAKLEVVEIPDRVEYTVEEHDGIESIHEKHRVWP